VLALQPPAFALVCVALWLVQLALDLLLLFFGDGLERDAAQRWLIVNAYGAALLGGLLVGQLPRALRWRPRRSVRPSPELKQERQRIARGLHDQVGSQLVNAMALVDARDPTAQPLMRALEQCLLDLRLLVDSMDGDDDALPDCLARLRHRIQPALDRRGIALAWDIALPDGVAVPTGAPARALTGIVQEAVSNVLQHSGASLLRIALRHAGPPQGGEWRLEVADNGRGLPMDAPHGPSGHGLAGMHRRAASVGGTLRLAPAEGGGTAVQVRVPG
jgi:signal transduction histidine kinase